MNSLSNLFARWLAGLNRPYRLETAQDPPVLQLLHFVAMFSTRQSMGQQTTTMVGADCGETARSRRSFALRWSSFSSSSSSSCCWAQLFWLSPSLFLLKKKKRKKMFYFCILSNFLLLFFYVLFSCCHSVLLAGLLVACVFPFYSSCYILVHFLFSCMDVWESLCVCLWMASLPILSDTWQMVVVTSELVSRGVVAFSTPPSFSVLSKTTFPPCCFSCVTFPIFLFIYLFFLFHSSCFEMTKSFWVRRDWRWFRNEGGLNEKYSSSFSSRSVPLPFEMGE